MRTGFQQKELEKEKKVMERRWCERQGRENV